MNKSRSQRIGIMGGTFNPVHIGHLLLAEEARENYELSKVLLIPCAKPPHKETGHLAEGSHRQAMLRLATEHDLHMEVSDIEMVRGAPSYSFETVEQLCLAYPRAELFFIIGADSLIELHTWKNIYRLLELCTIVTFGRPGRKLENINEEDLKLNDPWPKRLMENVKPGRMIDVSSSEIRYRIAEGLSINYIVPCEARMYICEHRLYQ